MATSGIVGFDPTIAEAIDEAFERCGIDPANITARHVKSAVRSLNYMLSSWPNKGVLQWTVDLQTYTTLGSELSFTPASGTIDVLDMTIRRGGFDTPMHVMSREEYHNIPDKDQVGKPDRFFVERKISPTVYIWPAAEQAGDALRYYRIKSLENAGNLSNTAFVPQRFQEAFVSGLAAALAPKFAPDREDGMVMKARAAFAEARAEDRERADMVVSVSMGRYGGRA